MKENNQSVNIFKSICEKFRNIWNPEINVYFISGMCYNCSVFDELKLPKGYKKIYIEWYTPHLEEPLSEYAKGMAQRINTQKPFVLVGYSFGGVIVQEMNIFLTPIKSIIISSFKSKEEIPTLFKAVRMANLANRIPDRLYYSTELITNIFNRFVYSIPTEEISGIMTYTEPVYIKWAVKQITEWMPANKFKHLHHIHGTEDQIFSYEHVKDAFPVEDGDHLMVLKKADVVSSILGGILLMKEE